MIQKPHKFLTLLLICISCSLSKPVTADRMNDEDFSTFITRFYEDSVFQQSRIFEPLEGEIITWADNGENTVEISWSGQKPVLDKYEAIKVYLKNVVREFENLQDSIVEHMYINNSGFSLERTFKLIDQEWFLVRYDIVNL